MTDVKPCKKCGACDRYPPSPSGRTGECRPCKKIANREHMREWRKNNRELDLANRRARYARNPEMHREHSRRHYLKRDPAKNRANVRRWEKNNPDKKRARQRLLRPARLARELATYDLAAWLQSKGEPANVDMSREWPYQITFEDA